MSAATGEIDRTDIRPAEAPVVIHRGFGGLVRRHPRLIIGGTLVVLLVLVAVFAPLLTPYDPTVGDVSNGLEGPSAAKTEIGRAHV